MMMFDVYDNRTNRCIYSGTWDEVKDYAENQGRYTVVCRENGQVM